MQVSRRKTSKTNNLQKKKGGVNSVMRTLRGEFSFVTTPIYLVNNAFYFRLGNYRIEWEYQQFEF